MTTHLDYDYLVLGAGVSGLTVAHDLATAGKQVALIEREPVVGGCAQTVSLGGFLFEKGPFNLLVRDPLFEELIDRISDRAEVVSHGEAATLREILLNGQRQPLPTSLWGAIKTPLLSPKGKLRFLLEPLLGKRPRDPDPTLGDLFRRRFGDEFVERILSAAVVGIFAGDCNRLSAKSCFRFFWEIDKDSRSFLIGGIKRRLTSRMNTRKWKGMVSFLGGLSSFCEALATPLGDHLHLGTRVTKIEREGERYRVNTENETEGNRVFSTGNLILGLDLKSVLPFLEGLAPEIASKLSPIESASLAVINLGFENEAFEAPPKGFGFLVPEVERETRMLGCLYASSVFPHQAPEGCHALRVFVGGYRHPDLLSLSDEDLSHHAVSELSKYLSIKSPPLLVQVARYPESIPQMVPGHSARTEEVEKELKHHPGLSLVGNYLHGVSVNDCICHARRTARDLIDLARSE